MGAFNTVSGLTECPVCRSTEIFSVQFKYGDTWQHQYVIGDSISWGGNDYGKKDLRRVAVEGIGDCPRCGAKFIDFDVIIEADVIRKILAIGLERPAANTEGYRSLD